MEKILVVNNDKDTMSLLKELLERKSYNVKYTSNKEECITIAERFKPDIVLVDILQKNCVRDLKINQSTSVIPLILMTGYSWNEKNNEVEVDDIIEKPFFLDQLETIIKRTIAIKKATG
ncbi:MAG: response regulator [Ferruginibacter sp.]